MASKLNFIETPLKGAFIIEPIPFVDNRGFFARNFCEKELKEAGFKNRIVQINHSKSIGKGVIRGLHYQLPPNAEVKIIKCIKGKIFDVVVDLRKNSPTFLKWYGIELTSENKKLFYVPEGFAHGFQSLDEDVEIIYFVSAHYSQESERGVRYNDPLININWIFDNPITSEKDANIPLLNNSFKGIEL